MLRRTVRRRLRSDPKNLNRVMPAEEGKMTIRYQGETVDATAKTVAEFLSARGVDPAKAIVEYGGEVYAPGADLSALALVDGASLDVFKMTAGG